jgi:hypothetical protein
MAKGFSKRATRGDKPKVELKASKFPATQEQETALAMAIKEAVLKVQAPAGSGKSTTLFYIGEHIKEKSLYLAYNKTMALEAREKCDEKGLDHIACMTTHSLAYQKFGKMLFKKLKRPRGRYVNVAGTPTEISKYYRLSSYPLAGGKSVTKSFMGLIVRDTCNRFEMSKSYNLDANCIPNVHLEDIKKKGIANIELFKKKVVRAAQSLWEDRKDTSSQVLATHNTYLKLFQLSKPDLSKYKVIYLDEAQDLNPVTHDIVMQQEGKCKIILVGDMYQSIYQFNGARNYLKKMKCPSTMLSKSFRFGEKIATIAKCVLDFKMDLVGTEKIDTVVGVRGSGVVDRSKPYTILYRTNMTLILDALDLLTSGESINLTIDVKDFVLLLKSCQALYDGDMRNVKHDSVIPYEDWEEILEDAKSIPEVKRVVDLVEGGETERIINILTEYRPDGNEQITLVTAHKSKGMEYDQVMLGDDFPSNYDKDGKWVGVRDEERNLLYVAVTRAINTLEYNSSVEEHIDYQGMREALEKGTNATPKRPQKVVSKKPPYCPPRDPHMDAVIANLPCEEYKKHKEMVAEQGLPDEGFLQEDCTYIVDNIRYDSYLEYLEVNHNNTEFESVGERQKLTINQFASEKLQALMKSLDKDI